MPTSRRQLHAFDVRSVLLFASLTDQKSVV